MRYHVGRHVVLRWTDDEAQRKLLGKISVIEESPEGQRPFWMLVRFEDYLHVVRGSDCCTCECHQPGVRVIHCMPCC